MEHEYTYKGKIELDAKESEIFSLLKEVVINYKFDTTMRVAGGWVRDKVYTQPFKLFLYQFS